MALKWIRKACVLVILVCLAVAAFDAFLLYQEEARYDELWKKAYHMPEGAKRRDGQETGVDLEALRALNPQCVGYISIPDTPLSYPVMQTAEEGGMFYLNHAFDRSSHGNGTPFLDIRCDTRKPSANLIVYGHNTRNTKMFSVLRFYMEKDYFTEHPLVRFDHENGGDYEIFAVLFVSLSGEENRDLFQMVERDPEDMEPWQEFLEYLKENSLYDTGVEVTDEDEILTLSTCYRPIENGRVLIFGRKKE